MAELAYAYASEAYGAILGGSNPLVPTKIMFENFFRRKHKDPDKESDLETTLPRSVLYEILNSGDGTIGKAEMLRLVRDGTNQPTAFANGALALAFKAGAHDPSFQRHLIKDVVQGLQDVSFGEEEKARHVVRGIAEGYIDRLPPDERAGAGKLKRMNLGGFHTWDERYKSAAANLAADSRQVFIVANSMITGLSTFVRSFRESKKSLHILMPAHMLHGADMDIIECFDTTNYPPGYEVLPSGVITLLDKDFTRPHGAVVVDDIRRTGRTEERIRDFWIIHGDPSPDFEPLEVMPDSSS